jgi:chemotaxis family two-component system sensor kinase Cph1
VPSTVTWGGDPRKPVLPGSGPVAVLPRRSFERWIEERRGHSTPWATWKVVLHPVVDLAGEQILLLQQALLVGQQPRQLVDLVALAQHHAVLTAFLHMQRRQIADPEARQAFSETSARVMSVARVHDI